MNTFIASLLSFSKYLFYPNPGNAQYGSMDMVTLLALSLGLLVLALTLRSWRSSVENSVTRKLSKTWSSTSFWFGVVGLVLTVARVEQIQFLAMRFLWVLWGAAVFVYLFYQFRKFRARHYQVLPSQTSEDPRMKYIPGKRK